MAQAKLISGKKCLLTIHATPSSLDSRIPDLRFNLAFAEEPEEPPPDHLISELRILCMERMGGLETARDLELLRAELQIIVDSHYKVDAVN